MLQPWTANRRRQFGLILAQTFYVIVQSAALAGDANSKQSDESGGTILY